MIFRIYLDPPDFSSDPSDLPVLLQSVPVKTELDRDVSAVFRTVRIVWLLLMPVLRTNIFLLFYQVTDSTSTFLCLSMNILFVVLFQFARIVRLLVPVPANKQNCHFLIRIFPTALKPI